MNTMVSYYIKTLTSKEAHNWKENFFITKMKSTNWLSLMVNPLDPSIPEEFGYLMKFN
jgi:hypothetical protein